MKIGGTIFEGLFGIDETIRYGVVEDRRIFGGKELCDLSYFENLVKESKPLGDSFLYLTIPVSEHTDSYIARFIVFRSEMHKLLFVTENHAKACGLLSVSAQKILN